MANRDCGLDGRAWVVSEKYVKDDDALSRETSRRLLPSFFVEAAQSDRYG